MPTAVFAAWLLGQHLTAMQWSSLPVRASCSGSGWQSRLWRCTRTAVLCNTARWSFAGFCVQVLAAGVILVTLNTSQPAADSQGSKEDYDLMFGLGASALSGLSSAYAGVYFEKWGPGNHINPVHFHSWLAVTPAAIGQHRFCVLSDTNMTTVQILEGRQQPVPDRAQSPAQPLRSALQHHVHVCQGRPFRRRWRSHGRLQRCCLGGRRLAGSRPSCPPRQPMIGHAYHEQAPRNVMTDMRRIAPRRSSAVSL